MTGAEFLTVLGIVVPAGITTGGFVAHRMRSTSTALLKHEGRLDAHDVLFEEREKRADERHEYVRERFDDLGAKIDILIKSRR